MFSLNLPRFFTRLYGEGKMTAISKLTYIWTLSRVFTDTIVDYGVYTSFGYHTNLQPISKSFLAIKDINKALIQKVTIKHI